MLWLLLRDMLAAPLSRIDQDNPFEVVADAVQPVHVEKRGVRGLTQRNGGIGNGQVELWKVGMGTGFFERVHDEFQATKMPREAFPIDEPRFTPVKHHVEREHAISCNGVGVRVG